MPEISRFLGIIIKMYFDEHNPPHFHAYYGEHSASVSISDLKVLNGKLPKKVEALIIEWAKQYKKELRENWQLMEERNSPNKIPPLQ